MLHAELEQLSTGSYKNLKEFHKYRDGNELEYLIDSPENIIRRNYMKQLCYMNPSIALYVHYVLAQNGVFEGISFHRIFSRYKLHEYRSKHRYEEFKDGARYHRMSPGNIWEKAHEFSDD
jgi:hypothetical protein